MELGLTEDQFWSSTPRELAALYRAKAVIEARQRFYMATSMGAKHKSGRHLTLQDFLPQKSSEVPSGRTSWQDQLALLRLLMKPQQLDGYEQTERGTWIKPE